MGATFSLGATKSTQRNIKEDTRGVLNELRKASIEQMQIIKKHRHQDSFQQLKCDLKGFTNVNKDLGKQARQHKSFEDDLGRRQHEVQEDLHSWKFWLSTEYLQDTLAKVEKMKNDVSEDRDILIKLQAHLHEVQERAERLRENTALGINLKNMIQHHNDMITLVETYCDE